MQVRIFESTDMTSGLKLVKDTLGPDALILSTRTIRNGKMGILSKPILEITAATDTPWPQAPPQYPSSRQAAAPRRTRSFSQWADDTAPPETRPERPLTYDARLRLQPHGNEPDSPIHHQPTCREVRPVMHNELDELKDMVKNLSQELSRLSATQQHSRSQPPPSTATQELPAAVPGTAPAAGRLSASLLATGANNTTATTMSADLKAEDVMTLESDNPGSHQELVQKLIHDCLHIAPPCFSERKKQHRLALVGPTGVGKTTTLAKIAAHYLNHYSASIALITIDTYRIAAVEQLKVYGEIMNLPVDVVITANQLQEAIHRHRDKELILIDTAGRSPRDSLCIEELATVLSAELDIDKHLVLSASTRDTELFETISRFTPLGIDNIIVTKTDECSTLGVILDIQMHCSNVPPFSYITNGQRVPEDLLIADRDLMTELILTSSREITNELTTPDHD